MTTIGPVLGGFGLLALLGGLLLFLPVPLFKRHRRVAKWLSIGGGTVFLLASVVSPAPPPRPPAVADAFEAASNRAAPAPAPSSTTGASDREAPSSRPPAEAAEALVVRDSGYYPPILNLELDAGNRREGAIFDDAGRAVLRLSGDAAAGRGYFARQVEAVNFTILGGPREGSMNRRIAHFTIPTAALRDLQKAGASPRGALDAATEAGSSTPDNDDVVGQFCLARSPICEKLQ